MATGIYRPAWVDVATGEGLVAAVAFLAEPRHPQYVGAMAEDEVAAHIARASGTKGRCRDYLAAVVAHLDRLAAPDAELVRLLARVDGIGVNGG